MQVRVLLGVLITTKRGEEGLTQNRKPTSFQSPLFLNNYYMRKRLTFGFPFAVTALSLLGCACSGMVGLAFLFAALALVVSFGIYLQLR